MPPVTWPIRIGGWLMHAFVGWRKRWSGLEHVPEGGFVLAANHLSNIDPFVLALPLWPGRVVHYMAKAELFTRWLTPALRAYNAFPVRRGEADAEAMRTAVRLLQGGGIVGMFPEGTRARKGLRKTRQPKPHPGTVRIALAAGVPLVPAAIAGTDRLLRSRVTVAYGPPVPLDDLAGMPRRQAAEIGTERLMAAIGELAAQVRAGGETAAAAAQGEGGTE